MTQDFASQKSIHKATTSRAKFSRKGFSLGAAGYVNPNDVSGNYDFINHSGDTYSFSPGPEGFDHIHIGAAWDNTSTTQKLLGFIKRQKKTNIDIDLGCLYELQNGERGAIQAFGELYGAYDAAPFIELSGDERTGDSEGDDEFLRINGKGWPEIARVLVYVYIYKGVTDWSVVKPQIHIKIPGHDPLVVTLSAHNQDLDLCVIAELENLRGGIQVTNYTEYFPGHEEMDRAYGFGLNWADGKKKGGR